MTKYILLILLLSSAIYAEDNIFSKPHIEGKFEVFYYNIDKDTQADAYATAAGGFLKYSTNKTSNYFASLRVHGSNSIFNEKNRVDTALFNNDDGDGKNLNVISEAYVGYRANKNLFKAGNMMLSTPMMNDDKTRIVPWSYQGVAFIGKSIPNTTLQLIHINAIRSHTSDEYNKDSASGSIGSDGITMLSFNYKKHGYSFKSYYYYAPKLYSTLVLQNEYEHKVNKNLLFCTGVQYFKSADGGKNNITTASNGGDDIDLVAFKMGIDSEDWSASLRYSKNSGDSGVVKGYGGLAKVYTTSMIANGRGANKPQTWMLKLTHDLNFSKYHNEIALWLTDTDTRTDGDDFQAYYLHYKHFFTEKSSLFVRYEHLGYYTDKSDANYLRVIASIRF
jgi:hypothetical protein